MQSAFPQHYAHSRSLFLEASKASGADLTSWRHSLKGPDGETLATDIAFWGDRNAERVLIVSSATHGVEGICGAGGQLALLASHLPRERAGNLAVVFVHALNPHGYAYMRRTTEDNIDLNRNFRDHSQPYPDDSAYAEVHSMVVPEDWDGPARRAAEAQIEEYVATRGRRELQAAVCRGQYSFANGLFFGGRHEAWSNKLFRSILREFAGHATHVGVIDLHSGLGARGTCEIISGAVGGSLEHRLALALFGDGITFPGLTSLAPAASGFMGGALQATLPDAAGALIVAEFGTEPFEEVLDALRADNWLHAYGGRGSPLWSRVKAQMKHAFACDSDSWRSDVAEQTIAIYRRAAATLSGPIDEAIPTHRSQP
jgi:hypothetical protein